uniref:Uncharacterized protein n=1 Tax=Neogobius melanostomus TaxID=47308 RepID=A0A8C6S685_9GOBI
MVHLRIRLEEKRKAIEAQKKKVEAAFTRHRQKMGHSAFLNVMKRKGDGAAILRRSSPGGCPRCSAQHCGGAGGGPEDVSGIFL